MPKNNTRSRILAERRWCKENTRAVRPRASTERWDCSSIVNAHSTKFREDGILSGEWPKAAGNLREAAKAFQEAEVWSKQEDSAKWMLVLVRSQDSREVRRAGMKRVEGMGKPWWEKRTGSLSSITLSILLLGNLGSSITFLHPPTQLHHTAAFDSGSEARYGRV